MTAIRTPATVQPLAAAVLGAALVLVAAGCALLHLPAHDRQMITISLGRCPQNALVAILHRGSASLVWPEFRDMVTDTARCGEHLIAIDASTGRQLGSFAAPASPTMRVPAPPPALQPGATSFQRAKHRTAMAAYQSAISKDVSLLRARARHLLAVWAAMVVAKVGEGNGFGLDSAGRSLTPAFESAMADLTSLRRAGVVLGNRKVLTVLGLEGLRDSVPKLLTNLGGAAVLVTGFPPKPDLQRDWRSGLRWEGAGSVTLLTRATITELTLDTARDLAEG